ncbi:hypothetical protein [Paraburkholderia terrae]|uniref:hypothetical protein n=1 Tax=Paraburkholderia terrae TaxID=311230 RepID=UPI001EE29F85|nr:hypothetical protein [Paraburkholderia terrae]GJH00232.1 hypothetical protein CBA19C8_06765 [Paraburkholderia terrae]
MAHTINAEFPVDFDASIAGVTLEGTLKASFYYTPAQRGSRENGIQMEPDEPESIEVEDVKLVVGGKEFPHQIDNKTIEAMCWEHLEKLDAQAREPH